MTADERTLRFGPSPRQRCVVVHPGRGISGRPPSERRGLDLVALVHGGFWRAEKTPESMLPMAHRLAALGVPVACLGYRTVEDGAGLAEMLSDLHAGLLATTSRAVQSERPLLVGHSAGGHLILHLTHQLPQAAAVALAPVTLFERPEDRALGAGAAHALYANSVRGGSGDCTVHDVLGVRPVSAARGIAGPVIVHGLDDQTIPVEMSQRYALHGRHAVHLHLLPAARHMTLVKPDTSAGQYVLRLLADRIAPRPRCA